MMKKIIWLLLLSLLLGAQTLWADPNKNTLIEQTPASNMVNINTADLDLLTTLRGIGKVRAQSIIDYREEHGKFKSLEDLIAVKGMSGKILTRLQIENSGRMVVK